MVCRDAQQPIWGLAEELLLEIFSHLPMQDRCARMLIGVRRHAILLCRHHACMTFMTITTIAIQSHQPGLELCTVTGCKWPVHALPCAPLR